MRSLFRSALCFALALAFSTAAAHAQSFTYQGELKSAGAPVNGTFDFDLRIYTAASGGIPIGPTVSANAVSVVDGRFTIPVNILNSAVAAAGQYLQVSVRPTGSPAAFVTLNPRTEITPTPLALRSLNERWSPGLGGALQTDPGITNVLINTSSPLFSDSVLTVSRTTANPGDYAGMYVNGTAAGSVAYYGWATNNSSRGEARFDGVTNLFTLVLAGTNAVQIAAPGLVGLGVVPTGTARLQVAGAVTATGDTKAASFSYQAPQNRVLSIPPEALHPINTTHSGTMGSGNGFAFLDAAVGAGNLTAPIYLPDNATITGFEAVYVDNSVAANLEFYIFKRVLTANGYAVVASFVTSGNSTAIVTSPASSLTPEVVNNETTCYNVNCFSSDWQGAVMAVKGLRIRYTVPAPQ